MKLSLKNKNIKVFVKVLKFLARTSGNCFMEMKPDLLELKTVDTKIETVITTASFERVFFATYEHTTLAEDEDGISPSTVLFPAKHFLNSVKHADKVSELVISFDNDQIPDRLIITSFMLPNRVVKIYNEISLMDVPEYDPFQMELFESTSEIHAFSTMFAKYLSRLTRNFDEFELIFGEDNLKIKNYPQNDEEPFKFNVIIDRSQFSWYDLADDNDRSMVLKSSTFVRMVNFTQTLNDTELKMSYSEPEQPLLLTAKNIPNVTVQTVVMTSVAMDSETIKSRRKRRRLLRKQAQQQLLISTFNARNVKRKAGPSTSAVVASSSSDESVTFSPPVNARSKMKKATAAPATSKVAASAGPSTSKVAAEAGPSTKKVTANSSNNVLHSDSVFAFNHQQDTCSPDVSLKSVAPCNKNKFTFKKPSEKSNDGHSSKRKSSEAEDEAHATLSSLIQEKRRKQSNSINDVPPDQSQQKFTDEELQEIQDLQQFSLQINDDEEEDCNFETLVDLSMNPDVPLASILQLQHSTNQSLRRTSPKMSKTDDFVDEAPSPVSELIIAGSDEED